ncbi:MAG: TonB-dependent receptor [Bacteroidales bacterium]|nr:TonB-dependent receptor [Bacteroidales bacterium]
MRKILFIGLLLATPYITYSQVVTITDFETNEPIELVTITSERPKASNISNSKGQVDISAFKDAEKIEFREVSYKPYITSYKQLTDSTFRIALHKATVSLDEVVVSASRWNQKSSEIPNRIISITPKSVYLQSPQTAADMLEISGKVFIQKSQQGGGSPMIRGFATNRLLYSVDGVRMNTAIFRGGNIQNVISLDPFAIEHTEVLFGPGSVIYGSDAIGGVMSFQTLTPQFSLIDKPLVTGKVITRYSSANNEKTGHININLGWKKWASLTSITSNDFGDLKMGSHGPDEYLRPFYVQRQDSTDIVVTNDDERIQKPSGYSQINVMQKLRFKPNVKWDFEYGFHYSETSEYSRYDRHIRYRNGLPRYGEWYYGPQKWMMHNLSIVHKNNNTVYDQVSLRLAQQFFGESRISRDFNQPEREIRIEDVNAWSANLDLIKSTGSRNQLFYGIEAVLNDVTSTGINENIDNGIKISGPARYPQSIWQSYAIYLSDQFNISKQFTLYTGIRYNLYILNAEFDTTYYPFPFTTAGINNDALTGNIGIIYRPNKTWLISTNASTAFRSPNVDDVGKVFDSEPGSVTVPNPDLEAEYAYNVDLSIVKIFSEILKVDITAYYTCIKNALVRRNYTINGMDSIMYDGELSQVQAIQNAAIANVYGIQAGIEMKLPAGFSISSDYNYQKGEEELDDGTTSPSRHAPPWFGVSRLNCSVGNLKMQLYMVYSGEKKYEDLAEEEKGKDYIYAIDKNGNPYSPGWYTLNFKAMYQLTEYLLFTAGLENITDQRYRPYSSGIAAPGRNFILSAKANF